MGQRAGSAFLRISNRITLVNEWLGEAVKYLLLGVLFTVSIEVILRYVFKSPTIWSWDVSRQIQGILLGMAGGYVFVKGGHVVIDVLTSRFPPRPQLIVGVIASFLVVITLAGVEWQLVLTTWQSVAVREHFTSQWNPPLFQTKIIIAIGVFFFWLQTLADFIKRFAPLLPAKKGANK